MKLTAVFQKVSEGYIAWVEELPGANTQAPTLEEARENLSEAWNSCSRPTEPWLRNLFGARMSSGSHSSLRLNEAA